MENIKESKKGEIIEDTKKKIVVAGEGLTLFERLLKVSKEYSLWDILKTILIAIMVFLLGFMMLNPLFLVERIDEINKAKHTTELNLRFQQTKEITSELQILLNKMHADRAFFIEYHNSVKSLEGAPFAFGSMDFEETQEGIDFISDEYIDFSLTKYKFVNYLNSNMLFVGNIEEIENIDKRLYLKLSSSGVKQIALIEVDGIDTPNGILGVTWSEHDVLSNYRDNINKELRNSSIRLSYILNKSRILNE